jgi:hypothetical protein
VSVLTEDLVYGDSPKVAAKKAAAAALAAQEEAGVKPVEKIYSFDENGNGDSLFEDEDDDQELPGVPNAPVTSIKPIEVKTIEGNAVTQDLPEEALVGDTLATICREYLCNFPRAYSWPALLTVAGAMVPLPETSLNETLAISAGRGNQTNLITCLIGPVGSGKTQVIEAAVGNLGLSKNNYSDVKAGSVEGLLAKLAGDGTGSFVPRQLLLDLDEWSHFFKKAGIDNAAFADVLNSGFNKTEYHLTIAGGKKIDLNCALSLIGGMVDTKVQECFGSSSTGGFYDRFLFGVCPTNNTFSYQPFNYADSALNNLLISIKPVRVKIDAGVWKLVNAWRRQDPDLGRTLEVTVRCAAIIASFDQRENLFAEDIEKMRPFLEYQKRARYLITPNPGENSNAQMCNAILAWLNKHTPNGEWATQRALKKGIKSQLDRLGAPTYVNALKSLGIMGAVGSERKINSNGPPSDLIRLIKGA